MGPLPRGALPGCTPGAPPARHLIPGLRLTVYRGALPLYTALSLARTLSGAGITTSKEGNAMERRSASATEVILGLAVGALGGFIAGILLAPQPGNRSRERLAENLQELGVRAAELAENVRGNTESLIASARTHIEESIEHLSESVELMQKEMDVKRAEYAEKAEAGDGQV